MSDSTSKWPNSYRGIYTVIRIESNKSYCAVKGIYEPVYLNMTAIWPPVGQPINVTIERDQVNDLVLKSWRVETSQPFFSYRDTQRITEAVEIYSYLAPKSKTTITGLDCSLFKEVNVYVYDGREVIARFVKADNV